MCYMRQPNLEDTSFWKVVKVDFPEKMTQYSKGKERQPWKREDWPSRFAGIWTQEEHRIWQKSKSEVIEAQVLEAVCHAQECGLILQVVEY
jgi:hypothetical protein